MQRITYTTQEVADILKVSKKTLLNWLRMSKIPEPVRNENNNYRVWTVDDIASIKKMIEM